MLKGQIERWVWRTRIERCIYLYTWRQRSLIQNIVALTLCLDASSSETTPANHGHDPSECVTCGRPTSAVCVHQPVDHLTERSRETRRNARVTSHTTFAFSTRLQTLYEASHATLSKNRGGSCALCWCFFVFSVSVGAAHGWELKRRASPDTPFIWSVQTTSYSVNTAHVTHCALPLISQLISTLSFSWTDGRWRGAQNLPVVALDWNPPAEGKKGWEGGEEN